MSEKYQPSTVWEWNQSNGGKFAGLNKPFAGATHDAPLPVGEHPLQLYSLATPNGVKITILLEELLAVGIAEAEYDAWYMNILDGTQFSSGFVELNPNSKIPVLCDRSVEPPVRVFESGSIMLYLAEKFGRFIPTDLHAKTECINWVFWQMGSAPYLGGGFGHFYHYAPVKIEYAIDRFALEAKRQLDVLDKHLATHRYLAGEEYSIADMIVWPWYGAMVLYNLYEAAEFLQTHTYAHLLRWAKEIEERPAVQRGKMVNRMWGEQPFLQERHSAADIDALLNT